jgi:hypothetical protein
MSFLDTTTSSWSDTKTSFKSWSDFLCSSANYFENQLLPNDLFIIRNHVDDEEDERYIKMVLESQGEVHIKVEIQSNSEFQSLTSSPTQSL